MRTDARPVIVFDLMAAKPVWHLLVDRGYGKGSPACGIDHREGLPIRRDHASKIGRQCDRCARMEKP